MNYAKTDLELMVGKDEKVLWRGKPNKRCYILEGIFNPMLPVAFIWLLIDSTFIGAMFFSKQPFSVPIVFFLLHLTPIWIYLGSLIFIYRKYKHTAYIVTDKGVYISGGLFSYTCNMKPFTELARVNIHRGVIDQIIGVGDVILTSSNIADLFSSNEKQVGMIIADIKDYGRVFDLIKKLQEDIYTDTLYPNALRPESNPGFKTKYKGLD